MAAAAPGKPLPHTLVSCQGSGVKALANRSLATSSGSRVEGGSEPLLRLVSLIDELLLSAH